MMNRVKIPSITKFRQSTAYLRLKGYSFFVAKKLGLIKLYGNLLSAFYSRPSANMLLTGVTGTNGKTTTSYLLHHALVELGKHSGLLGTTGMYINREKFETNLTTPKPTQLFRYLSEMRRSDCKYCTMEVSSIGIEEQRIAGLDFKIGVFTNLTQDHLDFHKSMEAYAKSKAKLFHSLGPDGVTVVNGDDPYWQQMVADTKARILLYGQHFTIPKEVERKISSVIKFRIIENSLNGLKLELNNRTATFKLSGSFNAYNLTAAYACLTEMGFSPEHALDALAGVKPPEGRMQLIQSKNNTENPTVIVDYAHTPDALEKLLLTIREIQGKASTIHLVFGCGGNRDRKKRSLMGTIAEKHADSIILTADNSRNEQTLDICADIAEGFSGDVKYKVEVNRKAAIKFAIQNADRASIVVIAGKGHEKWQEISGELHYHSDVECAHHELQSRSQAPAN